MASRRKKRLLLKRPVNFTGRSLCRSQCVMPGER